MSTTNPSSTPYSRDLAPNTADSSSHDDALSLGALLPDPDTTGPHQNPAKLVPDLNTTGPHQHPE